MYIFAADLENGFESRHRNPPKLGQFLSYMQIALNTIRSFRKTSTKFHSKIIRSETNSCEFPNQTKQYIPNANNKLIEFPEQRPREKLISFVAANKILNWIITVGGWQSIITFCFRILYICFSRFLLLIENMRPASRFHGIID